jgi:glycerol-3-phosphate dehydrogenase
MAQDAVDAVCRRLHVDRDATTARLPLVGAGPRSGADTRLERRFGSEAAAVAAAGPDGAIAPGLPMLRCEAAWAVAAEGAVTVDDVERRLRLDLVPEWAQAARPYVEEVVVSARRR